MINSTVYNTMINSYLCPSDGNAGIRSTASGSQQLPRQYRHNHVQLLQ